MILNRPWGAFGVAVAILAATYFLSVAGKMGLVDGDVGTRAVMAVTGLIVAILGNGVPKQLKRPRASVEAERRMQAGLRRVGWTMTLGGLAFGLTWVIAPEAVAWPLSLALMGVAFMVALATVLRCWAGSVQPS
jgi:hypothetical protein